MVLSNKDKVVVSFIFWTAASQSTENQNASPRFSNAGITPRTFGGLSPRGKMSKASGTEQTLQLKNNITPSTSSSSYFSTKAT